MELTGKKIVILVENMYNEFEFWYPYYRLKEAGAEVIIAGSGKPGYTGKYGIPAQADVAAGDVKIPDIDGVIIPGGYAPDMMRRHREMIRLVRETFDSDKIVAAICHAGWMLASAKILQNRKVTSFFAIKDDLIHAGADWSDEAVIRDGNLITSRTPDDLPVFMQTIIQAVSE